MSTDKRNKYQYFSDVLNKALQDNGLTQKELANIMNRDASQISRWINGKNDPIAKSVKLFADALQVNFYRDADGWGYTNKLHEPLLRDEDEEYMSAEETYYRTIMKENEVLRERVDTLHKLLMKEREKNKK